MALFEDNQVCDENVIPLKALLPDHYFEDDGTTALWVEIFEGLFCQLNNDIRDLGLIYDLEETDERFLDMIIRNLGFDLQVSLTVDKKRRLAKVIVQAYKQKGTCIGIENTIRQFVGVDVTCFPFTAGWILDISELAETTYLNPAPTNPAGFYTFDVVVEQKLSQEQRRIILDLIELIKPAHSHFRELVEVGEDAFVIAVTVSLNRGTLWLRNNQNTDGGWDALDPDLDNSNASLIENVGYHGVAQHFGNLFVALPAVESSFEAAATKLINDATYNFSGVKPKELDITLLRRGELGGVAGSLAKLTEALLALREFMKAMAFLNDFNPSVAAVNATTQAERDSTTAQKRAQFLYLRLTNVFGLGQGVQFFVRYIRDFTEVGDTTFAEVMTLELFSRTSVLEFETAFGSDKVGANAAIAYGLQLYNVGLIYETRIQDALTVLASVFDVVTKLYVDTFVGSGRLEEQAWAVDLFMLRNQFDSAKTLIEGIRNKQRIDGSFDDPVDVGKARLRGGASVIDSLSRAIKRINDEGI